MKYVSIDIETTGLNPETCQILELAAVVDDLRTQKPLDQLPKFQTLVRHPFYQGEPYALAMHPAIFKKLAAAPPNLDHPSGDGIIDVEGVMAKFFNFLTGPGGYNPGDTIVPAGKNFAAFDKNFIDKLPDRYRIRFRHRTLDPGMLFIRLGEDLEPPDSKKCMERAGLAGEVAHTALEDALMVVKLLRIGFNSHPNQRPR